MTTNIIYEPEAYYDMLGSLPTSEELSIAQITYLMLNDFLQFDWNEPFNYICNVFGLSSEQRNLKQKMGIGKQLSIQGRLKNIQCDWKKKGYIIPSVNKGSGWDIPEKGKVELPQLRKRLAKKYAYSDNFGKFASLNEFENRFELELFGFISGDFPKEGTDVVYFIQGSITRRIKIGRSRNLKQRFNTLNRSSSEDLSILGWLENKSSLELVLHDRFSDYLIRNEWFKPAGELLLYIKDNARSVKQEFLAA